VILDDSLTYDQPEAVAVLLGGEMRLEYPGQKLLGNAGSGV
jgi:hypothetical protein